MANQSKRFEDLAFTDDFMFCKVLSNNPDLCAEMTELILGRKVGEVIKISSQKPVEITDDGRGVRFDVYMEDDESTVYNIEMQTSKVMNIPFRTRYYQGMIDLDQMERRAKFEDLKTTFIIFICLDNPYPDIGLHKYTFFNTCAEAPHLEMGDGAYKVFLSTKGKQNDLSENPNLKAFLKYVAGNVPASGFTSRLDAKVKEAREHKEWRKEYMTLLERDERMREEGRKEGLKEGREEGLKEGREEERKNTRREAARADAAEEELARVREKLAAYEKENGTNSP